MRDERRARLAGNQERLLRALLCGAPIPEGFDARRVEVMALELEEKRWRNISRLRPSLARALGLTSRTTFHLYAMTIPRPPGNGQADAQSFYREVQRSTKLPQDAHLEQAAARGSWRSWQRPTALSGGWLVASLARAITTSALLALKRDVPNDVSIDSTTHSPTAPLADTK